MNAHTVYSSVKDNFVIFGNFLYAERSIFCSGTMESLISILFSPKLRAGNILRWSVALMCADEGGWGVGVGVCVLCCGYADKILSG